LSIIYRFLNRYRLACCASRWDCTRRCAVRADYAASWRSSNARRLALPMRHCTSASFYRERTLQTHVMHEYGRDSADVPSISNCGGLTTTCLKAWFQLESVQPPFKQPPGMESFDHVAGVHPDAESHAPVSRQRSVMPVCYADVDRQALTDARASIKSTSVPRLQVPQPGSRADRVSPRGQDRRVHAVPTPKRRPAPGTRRVRRAWRSSPPGRHRSSRWPSLRAGRRMAAMRRTN